MWAALGVLALLATLLTPLTTASAQATAPKAPTVTAKAGDKSVALSWTSGGDGGATIDRWEIRQASGSDKSARDSAIAIADWQVIPGSNASTNSYKVTGLTNGTAYQFQVRAVNQVGNGDEGEVDDVTPLAPPGAPKSLAGEAESSQITLSWTEGTAGGGSIDSYEYQQKTGSQDYASWTAMIGEYNADSNGDCGDSTAADSGATKRCFEVTGLTNGTTYQFKVRAVRGTGATAVRGAAAETKEILVATKPGAPTGLEATAGDTTVTLSWTAGGDGGSPITGWEYQKQDNSGDPANPTSVVDADWQPILGSSATTTTVTVVGLSNTQNYDFWVRATNGIGDGTHAVVRDVDPGKVPSKPTLLAVRDIINDQGNRGKGLSANSVTLSWRPGAANDSAITGWQYRQKTGNGDYGEWTAMGSTDVKNGTIDNTTTSTTYNTFTDATSGTDRKYTVTGLTAGTAYQFQVRAGSDVGWGQSAELAAPAVPGTIPSAPGNLRATSSYDVGTGKAEVTLSWTAGDDGGSSVTKWQYKFGTTAAAMSASTTWINICDNSMRKAPGCASTTSVTLPRPATSKPSGEVAPAAGNSYYFVIRAVNALGESLSSNGASTTLAQTVPSAPGGVYLVSTVGTSGSEAVTYGWLPPQSTGGAGSVTYEYSLKAGSGSWGPWISNGTTRSVELDADDGVKAKTAIQIRVQARNDKGAGEYTEGPVAVPGSPGSPGASAIASATSAPKLTATGGDTTVALTLSPGDTEGDTSWEVSYKANDGDFAGWSPIADPASAQTISGLTNGTEYTFKVRAYVGSGAAKIAGPASAEASAYPGTKPPAPANLTADGDDEEITLKWTLNGDGGSPITGWQYCLYKLDDGTASTTCDSDDPAAALDGVTDPQTGIPNNGIPNANEDTDTTNDDDDAWFAVPGSGPDTTTYTIKGLDNGSAYTYRVRAANKVGTGALAQAASATPGKAPAAPSRIAVTAGDAEVTIVITLPAGADNGSKITGYEVRKKEAGGSYDAWETLAVKSGTGTVTGLTNGVSYTFEVRAVNQYGSGAAKESATAATPVGAPPPGTMMAEAGNAQVDLSWSSGGSGGSDITGWEYRQKDSNGYGAWMAIADSDANTTSHTVTDLSNGIAYTFQVRAVNKLGKGDAFESAAVTPSTVPPQPASVTAARGNGQVDLSWEAGDSGEPGDADFAAATTGWAYRMKAGEGDYGDWMDIADSDGDTTSTNVGDLANGTAYVFQVRAMNVMGDGEATTSNAVTPATTPSAPTVSADRGDGTTTVSWTAGDNGGSAVTGWHLQINGGVWTDLSAYGVGATPMPLPIPTDDGTAYTFGIRGVNDVGEGEAGMASVEAGSTPAAPTVTATGGNGEITVSWTAGDNGGSSVVAWHHRTKISIGEYGDWIEVSADTTSVTMSDLGRGTGVLSYTFQVRGVNGVGEGDAGTSNEASPVEAPAVNGTYYSGVIDGPDFCANYSLGGARLFAHDSDGDGVADVCSLPYTRREAIARQNAIDALAVQHASEYAALVMAACAVTEGDAACGEGMVTAPPPVPINDGGPFYSGIITGPSFCADRSLGGPTTYPHDSDGDGVADVCALPYERREAIARQLAGDVLAATHPADFDRELASACRGLTGADYGDDPEDLANDACGS